MPTSVSDEGRLEVARLTAGYGQVTVVRDVNLRIDRGEFVCLLGANGVGKTTLLRAIMSDADISDGTVTFDGRDLAGRPSHLVTRSGMAIVPEGRALVADISVRDNLLLGSIPWNRRYSSAEVSTSMDEIFDRFPILGQRRNQLAGHLSGGEQQMLAIGRALMSRPRLLVLDEPSLGLAPLLIRQVFDDLAAANQDGLTILVAEQNAAAALRVAARSLVMAGGRIVREGTAESLRDSEELRAMFLGTSNKGARSDSSSAERCSDPDNLSLPTHHHEGNHP
jgi:branched-chain amino acid transport system ATP-binding protein